MPCGPPPKMTMDPGNDSMSMTDSLVKNPASFRPGISGILGATPVAMITRSASMLRSPTSSLPGPVNRAQPRMRSICGLCWRLRSVPETIELTILSLRSLMRGQLISNSDTRNPNSAPRLAVWMAFADPTRVLVGIHPTLIQVPPSLLPSIRATFAPIAAARFAAPSPPIPPPTTARLYIAIASVSWPYLIRCRECGFRLHVSYEELAPFTFVEESVHARTHVRQSVGSQLGQLS